MYTNRRSFLANASALALGASCAAPARAGLAAQTPRATSRSLHLLILGGTSFLGPALVESAKARGHKVTLFNRGKTNPHLFPELEKLVGDRDPTKGEGLKALVGREFDAVLDTSAYYPRVAEASAKLLSGHAKQYALVSSVSVYGDFEADSIDESGAVGRLDDPTVEEITGRTYGPLKALAEEAAQANFDGLTTILRPGLIVGRRDRTHRFSYWPQRVQRGGEVLVPGDGHDPAQYVDVRDLADFMLHTIETQADGVFNVVGPEAGGTLAELIHGAKAVIGGDAHFTYVDEEFLQAQGVGLPCWTPRSGPYRGVECIDHSRAKAAGLVNRPLAETVRDTLDYLASLDPDDPVRTPHALSPEAEERILAAWNSRGTNRTSGADEPKPVEAGG